MNPVIKKFVELEKGDKQQEMMLFSLWVEKITSLSLNDLQVLEKVDGKTLSLYFCRGNIVTLLHKPSGLFLLIYGLSALELETIKYTVEKSKNPDGDFISLVYEYLNKGNGRLGITQ